MSEICDGNETLRGHVGLSPNAGHGMGCEGHFRFSQADWFPNIGANATRLKRSSTAKKTWRSNTAASFWLG